MSDDTRHAQPTLNVTPPIAPFITSPASAYRADVAARDEPFGPRDGDWIIVATLLQHAKSACEPERGRLYQHALVHAREVVGNEELHRRGDREWQDCERTPSEAIVLLVDDVYDAGALNLAGVMLDCLLTADSTLTAVQRGRVIDRRARIDRKLGHVDEAMFNSRHVQRLARRADSDELRIRAWIGFASLAQMRGNYPEMRRYALRAARLADRAGFRSLGRRAYSALMMVASVSGRPDAALRYGWKVYQASIGDWLEESEILQNLAQVLLNAGHAREARAAFATVIARQLPARMMLPALGGHAVASAALGDRRAVEWAAREVRRIEHIPSPRFMLATALVECATALATVGRAALADQYRLSALRLAQAHGFHEMTYRAETLELKLENTTATVPRPLSRDAAGIAREIEAMAPDRLPQHILLAATGPA